ncbi:poly(A)-specific ribonuclease [Malassezia sp. CBS 17886]|nr:poly(A)-specific ribonuclease [Malassezia sp. CBS 17886]
MAEWTQQSHVLADHAVPGVLGAVTALHFDPYAELLWAGSASGQVSSHLNDPPACARYTSYASHGTPTRRSDVRGILCDDRSVISVGESSVRAAQRSGLGRWSVAMRDVAPSLVLAGLCASPQSASSDVMVAGATPQALATGTATDDDVVFAINVNSGRVVRRAPSEAPVSHMGKSGRYVCTGTALGNIQLRDPRTLRVEQRLAAHHGGLIDMQAEGNLVYSIGWTLRQGHRVPEPLIKVHDLRTMQALMPIPMTAPGGPARLAVHPKRSSMLAVATPQAQFQLVDTHNAGQSQFYMLSSAAYITSMAFSTSAEALAFGESDGSVRVWTNDTKAASLGLPVRFNSYPTAPPPRADYAPPPPVVEWRDDTPLATIGMPYYESTLLSAVPYAQHWSHGSPLFALKRAPLPGAVVDALQTAQGVQFAPLPKPLRGRRNMLVGADDLLRRHDKHGKLDRGALARLRSAQGDRRVNVALFRSERGGLVGAGGAAGDGGNGRVVGDGDEGDDRGDDGSRRAPTARAADTRWGVDAAGMPGYYRLMTIQYSRFGVDDFDFAYYNHTPYSGLETNIGNAYANSYLQALRFARPFCDYAARHTLMPCASDSCLLCEAGFLFRNLNDARGTNCQATNLLRVLMRSPTAAALNLLDDGQLRPNAAPYSHLVQSLDHFFLDHVSQQSLRLGARGTLSSDVLALCANPCAWPVLTDVACGACGSRASRAQLAHVLDLVYATPVSQTRTFAALCGPSFLRESVAKSACRRCRMPYAPHRTARAVASTDALPAVLCVNACVYTAEQMAYWAQPRFLSPYLALRVHDGAVHAEPMWDANAGRAHDAALYVLRANVVQIQGDNDAPHLCTFVHGPAGADPADVFLFNDFLVHPVSRDDALAFGEPWKVPAVVVWERVDAAAAAHGARLAHVADTLRPDTRLLTTDVNIAPHRALPLRHRVLDDAELPAPGSLVAIDTEFVELEREELEVFSDGARSLVRPSCLALARVSVLRGQGEHEGEPFIDDHIHTEAPVVDYLTQYSGIKPGDLDPATTTHTLVSRKTAYKKLRMLVDLGCRFIGHGLAKDFRIVNIYVPPAQVIDTVALYHSASHPRNCSLRFLAWFLLKQNIQKGLALTHGDVHEGHDSIEDADAALKLYRRYEVFERDNRLEDVLDDLYEVGPRVGWRPPGVGA